jgi:hypothetical protein
MNPAFLYRIHVTGEKHLCGFVRNDEPVIFSEQHINQLKQMSEAEQETFAESIKNQY